VLVVDDSSPDGTGEAVKEMARKNSRIRLLERPEKNGLGRAYLEGFTLALDNGADLIVQMDADFSHDPRYLIPMIECAQGHELVIGSRYIKGVSVINWPLRRLFLSYGANVYARLVTGLKVMDCTSGFKVWQKEILRDIDFSSVQSNGYSFQIEMTFRALKNGSSFIEYPIIFVEREQGQSKMTGNIINEAVFMVWKLRFNALLERIKDHFSRS
jgi:dolichol-phosphate mannosyltransferase